MAQKIAKEKGYSDVLYLDAVHKKYLEEVSLCNIFVIKVTLPTAQHLVSDFIQLHWRPDGSVSFEEHQYILKNPGNEQNDLLCGSEQTICRSKYLKTREGLICDTESACVTYSISPTSSFRDGFSFYLLYP